MIKFALKYPYFIIVSALMTVVVGIASLVRMPVDLFPPINIPVVVVATFYSGMPAEQIETDITGRFERFFTLGSGIDHIESRSLPGVSLIKVYFQPGVNPDTAVTTISNLAMADLRKLPPGTLPPVVLRMDASNLPVCLVTLKGEGLNETHLRDLAQYDVRNQIANVPGASVPQPFGGKYRQIMVYLDPEKLQAHQLSAMDVVRGVNENNLILPSGDVRIGFLDYNLYTNSQIPKIAGIGAIPLKTVGDSVVTVADIGSVKDAAQIQYNIVRVDGQPSVYLPIFKQGGDTNTISVVDGIREGIRNLVDVPRSLIAKVVFDQSRFVRFSSIKNLIHEGAIGLILTGLMILLFLGKLRATFATFLSIPLSALAAFIPLSLGGGTINSMVLGGLALAFSRLIDNSVVVLENIFRHMEMGKDRVTAARDGSEEVAMPVLAATLTTAIVFFPVTFLAGVSKFLFSALAMSVVLSLAFSYIVALTVVPLYCSRFLRHEDAHEAEGHGDPRPAAFFSRVHAAFNAGFSEFLARFDRVLSGAIDRPRRALQILIGCCAVPLLLLPFLGMSYFPRTDPAQFVINLKAVTGTRLEETQAEVARVEHVVREIVAPEDLQLIVSNVGTTPGFSSIFTSNSASHTAFVQVALSEGHRIGSYEYMTRVRAQLHKEVPEISIYLQSGGLVDAVLNLGLPAPIDVQIAGSDMIAGRALAGRLARSLESLPEVSDLYIPQDVDAAGLRLDVDRYRASALGLTQREVVSNVITSLTSNSMIAPSYWIDPESGNDYLLTVQYPDAQIRSERDLLNIPLRAARQRNSAPLDAVGSLTRVDGPTEVDHYQLRRVVDLYVSPKGEDLSALTNKIEALVKKENIPEGTHVSLRGTVQGMRRSFSSFGLGLLLSIVLIYLVLVAQFKSFSDPLIVLLAVPGGLAGVIVALVFTGSTLNIMSLMGVVMLSGVAVSNSILIVDYFRRLLAGGIQFREALRKACMIRLRPILMTSLATIFGLLPMALRLGEGSEAYAPLARAIIGGLCGSLVLTVFLVPVALVLTNRGREPQTESAAI